MPVLELDDGTCISESATICRYLEETNPNPSLMGNDALDRALVDMWHRRMEFELLDPIIKIFVHTGEIWKGRVTQISELAQINKVNVLSRMEWLDKELIDREFIAGGYYTVADITAQCAFVMAKAAVDIHIPAELTNLSDWWARVSSRPTARA
jgi:glutathione S-transferase